MPEDLYTIPFGEANVVREGADCHDRHLWPHGASCTGGRRHSWPRKASSVEIVDLRTLSPLDLETVLESVDEDRTPGMRR